MFKKVFQVVITAHSLIVVHIFFVTMFSHLHNYEPKLQCIKAPGRESNQHLDSSSNGAKTEADVCHVAVMMMTIGSE